MILIIEDDGALSKDISTKLCENNLEAKIAYSYLSAMGLWNKYQNEINCIILDLNINPDGMEPIVNSSLFPVNGLAFLKEIKWKSDAKLPVIVYSGYTSHLQIACEQQEIPYKDLIVISKSGFSLRTLIDTVKNIVI